MRPTKQPLPARFATFSVSLAILAAPQPAVWGQEEQLGMIVTEKATYALSAWLESEDSDLSELTALTRYGQSVVPSLAAALDAGPSPARRERLRRSLNLEYDELATQVRKDATRKIPSREDYIAHYLGNFEALYRARAAQALGALGGQVARNALESALGKTTRSDVRTAIQRSLEIK